MVGGPLVTGIDISKTAVERASKFFPEISYIVGDSRKENPFLHEPRAMSHQQFNLVVIKEDGFLYVSQSFPESDNWVGKDVIDSPERLKDILAEYVESISICFEREFRNSQGQYVH